MRGTRDVRDSVLFVVDVQNGFRNEASAPAIGRIVPLVRGWVAAGLPVIFTRYHNYPGSKFERLLDWTEVQHAPDTELVPELLPLTGGALAVVDKTGYSVFTAEVAKLVEEHGWTDLLFCGLDTDTCVLKSAADAFEREHTPWLIRDACASHGGRGQHRSGVTMIAVSSANGSSSPAETSRHSSPGPNPGGSEHVVRGDEPSWYRAVAAMDRRQARRSPVRG